MELDDYKKLAEIVNTARVKLKNFTQTDLASYIAENKGKNFLEIARLLKANGYLTFVYKDGNGKVLNFKTNDPIHYNVFKVMWEDRNKPKKENNTNSNLKIELEGIELARTLPTEILIKVIKERGYSGIINHKIEI